MCETTQGTLTFKGDGAGQRDSKSGQNCRILERRYNIQEKMNITETEGGEFQNSETG